MTSETLTEINEWFKNYTESFYKNSEQFRLLLIPRVEHNNRVSEYCRILATDLSWTAPETLTVQIIGLLHDIGRFSQFKDYGTFNDSDSVNHGKRGYEVIRRSNVLSLLPPENRRIILDGIRYHNNREYAGKADPESIEYVKLVRDADKLDKFIVAGESLREARNPNDTIHALTVEMYGPANRKALEEIKQNKKVSKKNIRNQIDYHLLQLSWIFEISCQPAFNRIVTSGVIEQISAILPDNKQIRDAVNHVKTYIKNHRR